MSGKFRRNTPEEEAAIKRGIARDSDNPERDDAFFAEAKPAEQVIPALTRRRGPGRKVTKTQVTLRLDREVVDGLRASGPGWQGRANEALRQLVAK
jgi:uncharacterized protein (DUF4415 family)